MAEQDKWSLKDVEECVQARLDFLSKGGLDDDQFDDDWLPCYMAFAQVKQAQALERIVRLLEGFKISGFPVENVS